MGGGYSFFPGYQAEDYLEGQSSLNLHYPRPIFIGNLTHNLNMKAPGKKVARHHSDQVPATEVETRKMDCKW